MLGGGLVVVAGDPGQDGSRRAGGVRRWREPARDYVGKDECASSSCQTSSLKRFFSLFLLGAVVLMAAAQMPSGDTALGVEPAQPLDSAKEELRVGRAWHAARILRSLGIDRDDPERTLMLARAEAGWKNWPGVGELLDHVTWLDDVGAGEGWLLLGRAREDAEQWPAAADAYEAFLRAAKPGEAPQAVALTRLARASAHADRPAGALDALDAIPSARDDVRSWMALELAERAADAGDTASVWPLLARVHDGLARDRSWALVAEARLAAGDSAGAEREYRALTTATRAGHQAEAMIKTGVLALARGDEAGAEELFSAGLDSAAPAAAARAARGLIAIGNEDLTQTLRLAGIVDRAGDGASALRAYDRAAQLAAARGESLSGVPRLARARLMGTVHSRQAEAIEEFRAIRASSPAERLGARNLETWATLRRRQGRTADVRTLRKWLQEEYPTSPEAAEVLWDRASAAEGGGDIPGALKDYGTLIREVPALARAGEARMRIGQIELGQGRPDAAARVYESYLTDFPDGRRWEEASFWAARTRFQLGDTAAARGHIARIRREEPVSYYAVLGAKLLGEVYQVDVPTGSGSIGCPWLTEGLAGLDVLVEAGLEQGATAVEDRLVAQVADSIPLQFTLAEALNARGRTIAGINLGWAIRREGHPWDGRLLRIVYPFPYREMVAREAAEWGVDPFMLAALIRQESAFKADVESRAGAIGLMQVMPPTGKELARSYGPVGFQTSSLTTPEVNLHLGAAFFVNMNRRYGGDLPLVLSAYNAGPTRATRWKRYPEVDDPERFTERIPFEETRGYVKNVRRNLGVYRVLYGDRE